MKERYCYPFSHEKKWRLEKLRCLAMGYSASIWRSLNLNPGLGPYQAHPPDRVVFLYATLHFLTSSKELAADSI